jgi:hypothetical protein
MTDYLKPSATLLCKLGSIAVHADEMLSPGGHAFDRIVLQKLLQDEEVTQWIMDMGPLLPQKRS